MAELEYHVLPLGYVVEGLNILREAAGLGPWRDDGDEVGGYNRASAT